MVIVFCYEDTCIHNNQDSTCTCESITIDKEFGEIEQGRHVVHPTCQNYRSKENAEN